MSEKLIGDGTRLCQLLEEWAAEDLTMADLYEEIKFSDLHKLFEDFNDSRTPPVGPNEDKPVTSSSEE